MDLIVNYPIDPSDTHYESYRWRREGRRSRVLLRRTSGGTSLYTIFPSDPWQQVRPVQRCGISVTFHNSTENTRKSERRGSKVNPLTSLVRLQSHVYHFFLFSTSRSTHTDNPTSRTSTVLTTNLVDLLLSPSSSRLYVSFWDTTPRPEGPWKSRHTDPFSRTFLW